VKEWGRGLCACLKIQSCSLSCSVFIILSDLYQGFYYSSGGWAYTSKYINAYNTAYLAYKYRIPGVRRKRTWLINTKYPEWEEEYLAYKYKIHGMGGRVPGL